MPHSAPNIAVPIDEFAGEVTPQRLRAARAVIVLTALVTLMAFGVIFYRWATVHDPTSAIVIQGDVSLDGALIVVTSNDNPDFTGAKATLSESNHYQTPILLDPGIYSLVITLQDRVLVRQSFKVDTHRGLVFPLALLKSAQTKPSGAVGAGNP